MTASLLLGDCIERMRELEAGSVDAVVTDPPYGIGFMDREWDSFSPTAVARRAESIRRKGTTRTSDAWPDRVGAGSQGGGVAIVYDESQAGNLLFQTWTEEWAGETLRLLRPGGHMVVFAGTRTYHRVAAGVEDAGFEIRDQLCWLFGNGYPKSRNLGEGRGTGLKPGYEPILLARKPFAGTVQANVDEHGTGGLNVEACRIELTDQAVYEANHSGDRGHDGTRESGASTSFRTGGGTAAAGRWPANVLLDESAAELLDAQTGELVSGANPTRRNSDKFRDVYGEFAGQEECEPARGVDRGGASRFYHHGKTSESERNAGLGLSLLAQDAPERNDHPTVKPLAVMRWLLRLVTPPGGTVLDPFMGSGTTGAAAALEQRGFVGIEREAAYMAIAEARIAYWEAAA